jgi:hypothetical protein
MPSTNYGASLIGRKSEGNKRKTSPTGTGEQAQTWVPDGGRAEAYQVERGTSGRREAAASGDRSAWLAARCASAMTSAWPEHFD